MKKIKASDLAMIILTAMLAIASIFADMFTYNGLKETERITKETFERQDIAFQIEHRAYIQVEGATDEKIRFDLQTLSITDVFIAIKNTGSTPATNINIDYNTTVDSVLMDTTNFKHHSNGALMGAGQTFVLSLKTNAIQITDFFFSKQHIFICGKITYADFFNKRHFVDFCFKAIPFVTNPNTKKVSLNSLFQDIADKNVQLQFVAVNEYNKGN